MAEVARASFGIRAALMELPPQPWNDLPTNTKHFHTFTALFTCVSSQSEAKLQQHDASSLSRFLVSRLSSSPHSDLTHSSSFSSASRVMSAPSLPPPSRDAASSGCLPTPLQTSTDDEQHSTPDPPGPPGEPQADDLEKPPESPLTPTASFAELPKPGPQKSSLPCPQRKPKTTFPASDPVLIDQPQPIPISDFDAETDVLAIRSAISILQIQRQKAQNDIKTLERIKKAAVASPEEFVEELKSGRTRTHFPQNDYLGPTLAKDSTNHDDITMSEDESERASNQASKFPRIPQRQNVVRVPPINWDKYQLVGESLDKLHEQQRKAPSSQWSKDAPNAPDYVVAAPWSPADKIDSTTPSQRKDSKKAA
ncbi:hypothetical protein EJ05DRAFT_490280 [Pseudovirgaria hyperparasitica]|uniref:Uncharacterized protein n=1 Tax=Pseudovirgaria hyperparasitica TaxID=470096 RepID=A0A6A6VSU6_9PEZI|nr:uncharacterized protein EJ05DRAFT_490280 [Pseudovirgaria hyperparasitica]KAF2753225.1 hypothetical protein EJ05DRAFT_490280 [Pseudovirgaria hyperparasitica]